MLLLECRCLLLLIVRDSGERSSFELIELTMCRARNVDCGIELKNVSAVDDAVGCGIDRGGGRGQGNVRVEEELPGGAFQWSIGVLVLQQRGDDGA